MNDCIFCRIVAGEARAAIVHEDAELLAFRDVRPQAPVHLLLVPKRHVASLDDAGEEDRTLLGGILLLARRLAAREGVSPRGYRLVTNCGSAAGQTVYHLHFHLLGGRPMGWPPG